jgi:uncharacterized protein
VPAFGWYYRLSRFFRESFGERVLKIPLDAGMTCPNRDGTLSYEGCIFCYNPGFSPAALSRERDRELIPIPEQIRLFQLRAERPQRNGHLPEAHAARDTTFPQRRYLAYFQSYSNTHAPLPILKELYEEALQTPGIVGLSVATRPDCLAPEVLDLLAGYARDYHIWLELGLQSAHDTTLQRINRGHAFAAFREAVKESSRRGLQVCVHIINGLPGESHQDMLETARVLSALPLKGIKFHQLQVMEGTPLAELYRRGEVTLLSREGYLEIVCDQLEILPEDVVVHRLLSEVTRENLQLAPAWRVSRADFARMVEETLKSRCSYQGKYVQGKR